MERRRFLQGLVAGGATLSGCSGALDPGPSDGTVLTLEAELLREFAADSPARVEIGIENASDATQRVSFGPTPPFSTYESSPKEPGLALVPERETEHLDPRPEEVVPTTPESECWQATDSFFVETIAFGRELPPGESLSGTYRLLAHPNNEACLPDGRYTFPRSYGVRNVADADSIDRTVSVELEVQIHDGSVATVGVGGPEA